VARLVAAGTARRWSHPAQARSLSGAPKLNSIPRGPVSQHVTNRDIHVQALEKAGRAAEIARLLRQCGVSRLLYVADTDARALAEAKEAELWYQ
jgi:hypothetical protein